MRTHNTGVVSSIPPCVTFKTPLVRKATGNHLMKSISLEKLRALSLVSATLEIEHAMKLVSLLAASWYQFLYHYICSLVIRLHTYDYPLHVEECKLYETKLN